MVVEETNAEKAVKKEITTVRRLAALWSPRYFTCFWCVYEVGSWLHLDKEGKEETVKQSQSASCASP